MRVRHLGKVRVRVRVREGVGARAVPGTREPADVGRYGDVGRCRAMLGDVGRCREM